MRLLYCLCSVIFVALSGEALLAATPAQPDLEASIQPERVRIARDSWGVPHIFGPDDPHVAYGLAWANAEDAFAVMQETVLTGKGMMGMLNGKDGLIRDYLLAAFDIPTRVQHHYQTQLSAETRAWVSGYAQGLNAFARSHPDEVLVPGTFPVSPQELLQGQVFVLSYMVYAMREVEHIFDGDYALEPDGASGSNAYALAPSRTIDGKTYLAINPHQPMQGPFSFYECHLVSGTGLDFHGAMYHNGIMPGFGTNNDLGWAMTYNKLDLVDTYRLERHPKKKHRYRVDGEWRSLEVKRVWLPLRVGPITVRIPRTLYWSDFGPVFRREGEYFAVRFGMLYNHQAPEQIYRMMRSENLTEFKEALTLRGVPRFNVVYADKGGNVFYLDNGQIPDRLEGPDWKDCVDGNSDSLIWTQFLPFDSLPQMLNPPAGFVFNTNNSPFLCTAWQDNLDSTNYARFPKHAGYSHGINNRALRFMELIEQEKTFDFDAFKAIKFDQQFPKCSPFLASCESLFNLDTAAYPHLATSLGLLHRWNRHVDLNSAEATLFAVTIDQLFATKGMGYEQFFSGFSAHPPEMAQALEDAQDYLMTHFNSIDVPWGDIQRLVRGEVNLPLPGYFDMLAANYSRPAESGQYEAWVGDAYTQFAVFGPDGLERLETLLPYGSSTRPENAHYTDQMALYTAHQTKTMPLDTSIILEQAQHIYRLPVVP